jgi:hypothetical protein
MKKLTYIFTFVVFSMMGCNTDKLDPQTAVDLIQQEYQYPQLLEHNIFCADPKHARKVLEAGLEEQGLVQVQRTQHLQDVNEPLITFTEVAKPYFLPVSEKDKGSRVQKVKIADEEFSKINNIRISDSGKNAVADYTTVYTNVTPFSTLLNKTLPNEKQHQAYFSLTNKGWKIVEKADIEFLELIK